MKITVRLLVLAFTPLGWMFPLQAQEAWETADTTGLRGSWNSVAYGNGVYVAVNGWGEVARSTDGGQSWTEVLDTGWAMSDIEYGFNGAEMAFWTTGRGSGDFLYESTDGGQTWTDIAGDFGFLFSDGGHDVVLDASGNLIYTKVRANNNFSDAFLYEDTYYIYGGGPESSISSSSDGQDYSEIVADSGQWLLGGIQVGDSALLYGAFFEVPGDFNTRRGAVYDLTTDPAAPANPKIIETSVNTYVSDIDMDPVTPTTLYATGAQALLTSTDNGATWTVDALADGTSVNDMAEMAVSDNGRVAVGLSGIYYISSGNGGGNETTEWAGYPIVDGYVNTGSWLGMLYVLESPWVFSQSLGSWIWFPEPDADPEGGWIHLPL